MALDLDAFAVLRAINANPAVFSNIRSDAIKASGAFVVKLRGLLVRLVKGKATSISAIRDVRSALGSETFDRIADAMKDSDLKSIIGKLDKHHPDQKSASADWRRRHLRALLDGSVQPSLPQPKKKSPAQSKKTSPGRGGKSATKKKADIEFLEDESAGAVRKRS